MKYKGQNGRRPPDLHLRRVPQIRPLWILFKSSTPEVYTDFTDLIWPLHDPSIKYNSRFVIGNCNCRPIRRATCPIGFQRWNSVIEKSSSGSGSFPQVEILLRFYTHMLLASCYRGGLCLCQTRPEFVRICSLDGMFFKCAGGPGRHNDSSKSCSHYLQEVSPIRR